MLDSDLRKELNDDRSFLESRKSGVTCGHMTLNAHG